MKTLKLQIPLKNTQRMAALAAISFLASCGASHKVASHASRLKPVKREAPTTHVERAAELRTLESYYSGKNPQAIDLLLKDAEKYLGAPYKFGGVTSSGFDCSGFTSKVFSENEKDLPRRSTDQAASGKEIDIREVRPGDLLFFATAGGTKVSHVAIVHDIGRDGEVKFIHASSSKGVIISSLNEKYWNKAFLHAQRIL